MCERNVALGKSCSPPVLGPAACLEPSRAQPGRAPSSACSTRSNGNTDTCSPGCLGTSPRVPFAGLMQQWLLQENPAQMKKWRNFSHPSDNWGRSGVTVQSQVQSQLGGNPFTVFGTTEMLSSLLSINKIQLYIPVVKTSFSLSVLPQN